MRLVELGLFGDRRSMIGFCSWRKHWSKAVAKKSGGIEGMDSGRGLLDNGTTGSTAWLRWLRRNRVHRMAAVATVAAVATEKFLRASSM